ncbi:uncharacterized protein LOC131879705 isoform X2 [Tigriopus californicus]|uniref:uncharacterized protein LOC131879705 isoform X2 n=1 Tax=Tigriopus californicus TaxID=6832 RepID=UPI0027D9DFAE|nr:uncharacterized protein LOC131879705 isoform X2 [Tigriopus californicus]
MSVIADKFKSRGDSLILVTSVVTLLTISLLTTFVFYNKYQCQQDMMSLQDQINSLQYQMTRISKQPVTQPEFRRKRALPMSRESPLIMDVSLIGNGAQTTQGLRVYDAFFQHQKNEHIPNQISNENLYRQQERVSLPLPTTIAPPPPSPPPRPSRRKIPIWHDQHSDGSTPGSFLARRLFNHFPDLPYYERREKIPFPRDPVAYTPIDEKTQGIRGLSSNFNLQTKAANNRRGLRMNNIAADASLRHNIDNSSSLSENFLGLKAIHYVATINPVNPSHHHATQEIQGLGRVENEVGRFEQWVPARWASRMGAIKAFPMTNEGRMTITQSGIYYLYVQINYLDSHDVNSYQILANGKPLFSCTSMTQTKHPTSDKANTCFTGGVTFLEKGDLVSIHDLQPGRFAVLVSSHSFFGAIQLSQFGGH